MSTKRSTKTELVGQFFHSFIVVTVGGEKKKQAEWQGQVLSSPHPGYYLVQLFSWMGGEDTNRQLVKIEDMLLWRFYPSADEMRDAYDKMPSLGSADGSKGFAVPAS